MGHDDHLIDEVWKLTMEGIRMQLEINSRNKRGKQLNVHFAELAATLKPYLIKRGSSMALWSGGYEVSLYARELGHLTLESTPTGGAFDELEPIHDWGAIRPMWSALSAE